MHTAPHHILSRSNKVIESFLGCVAWSSCADATHYHSLWYSRKGKLGLLFSPQSQEVLQRNTTWTASISMFVLAKNKGRRSSHHLNLSRGVARQSPPRSHPRLSRPHAH